MRSAIDQTGRKIELPDKPQRIISVVPSQTELLYDLGLEDEVVGITKFCVHPDKWLRGKPRVGGTKNLDIDKIRELQPDLVIANKEENVKEQIEEIEKFCPVWISDVHDLQSAVHMICSVAEITGKEVGGNELINNIRSEFEKNKPETLIPACYLIWKDPMMTVGADTFISEMMKLAGFRNIYEDHLRYPEITAEHLKNSEASVIMLSTEPYPFKEADVLSFQNIFPDKKIILVDGEMFSWYGSRMLKAAGYFRDNLQV
jgi:ABC-type Fe3+-hydroxamate transport system substrate-binding protein